MRVTAEVLFALCIASPLVFAGMVWLTRAGPRRAGAALAGCATAAVFSVGWDALAAKLGWWHYPSSGDLLATLAFSTTCAFLFGGAAGLAGWRIMRAMEWTGAITCKAPIRGRWGGPPSGVAGGGIKAAQDLAFAPRGKAVLPELVRQDIPELEVKAAGAGGSTPSDQPPPVADPTKPPVTPPATTEPKKKSGCGCQTDGDGGALALAGGLGVVALVLRRRNQRSK